MSNDTTKTGVSDDNAGTTIEKLNAGKPKLERDEDISSIADNARKAREKEREEMDIPGDIKSKLESNELEDDEINIDGPDEKKPDDQKRDEDLAAKKPTEPATEAAETVLVKVNGIEKRVLKADVDAEGGITAYQKARAADEKMRQAADIRRQNEERERILAERELAIAQQEQALLNKDENSSKQPSTDAASISERAQALTEKMYSGDEKIAAQAVQELMDLQKGNTHEYDPDAVSDQISERVHREIDRIQAVADFKSEHKEIDSNPEYRKYADQATIHIAKEHQDWTPRQVIMEAGEQARLKFADQLRENDAADEDEARLNNKRATDNVRGADAKVSGKPKQKALTQSQIIEQIRSGRSHSDA